MKVVITYISAQFTQINLIQKGIQKEKIKQLYKLQQQYLDLPQIKIKDDLIKKTAIATTTSKNAKHI